MNLGRNKGMLYWLLAIVAGILVGEFLKPIDKVMDMVRKPGVGG